MRSAGRQSISAYWRNLQARAHAKALNYNTFMSRIVLWVSDINHQAEFYSALLAAPISSSGPEFSEVSDGQNSVLIHLLPEQYRSESSEARDEVAIKPIFNVADIDAALSRIGKFTPRIGAERNSYGDITYQDCIDPEGNVIQLSQRFSRN